MSIEWILCPECGKKLLRADTSKPATLYPWCKKCKDEIKVHIGPGPTTKEECQTRYLTVTFKPGMIPDKVGCKRRKIEMPVIDEASDGLPTCTDCPHYK